MGEKAGRIMSRRELAEFLQNLSEQLGRGVVEAQGRSWTVPEDLEVHLEFKDKKGRLVAKLSWSGAASRDDQRAAREEAGPGPVSLKAVKKRMGTGFKELQRVIRQGAVPDGRSLKEFADDSRAFASLAPPEWEPALREYLDHLANLQQAAAARQPEALRQELQALQDCMSSCHREFKGKGGKTK